MSNAVSPMAEFIRRTAAVVAREPEPSSLLRAVSEAMKPLLRDAAWLPAEFAAAHPQHYQQYLLYCDPFERFSIVSFVWGPGQQTPIHDHMTWGVVGQLRGREVSTNYRYGRDGRLEISGVDTLEVGQTISFSPELGDIHAVVNSSEEVAVSIHAYGANIGTIQRHVYDAATGEARAFVSGYSAAVLPNFWA
jgi:predicted metal-dependent enzyme (double-stranded beta helix superfamily)